MESVRVGGESCTLTVELLGRVFLLRLRLQGERRFSQGDYWLQSVFFVIFIFRVETQSGVESIAVSHLFHFVAVALGRLLPASRDVRDSVSAGRRCHWFRFRGDAPHLPVDALLEDCGRSAAGQKNTKIH